MHLWTQAACRRSTQSGPGSGWARGAGLASRTGAGTGDSGWAGTGGLDHCPGTGSSSHTEVRAVCQHDGAQRAGGRGWGGS